MGSRRHTDRTITASGLALLLERLHPDTEQGAAEYERLRRSLIRFFDWRGIWPADECADETIDRLARRLEAQQGIEDPRSYAYGIARMVLLERRRQPAPDPLDQASEVAGHPSADDEAERVRTALDRCLEELPADARSLLFQYYEGEHRVRITSRRRLAAALGLSDAALRNRVQRLRDRLERCLEQRAQNEHEPEH